MIRLWDHVGRALLLAFGLVLLTNAAAFAQHDGAITAPSANAIVSGTVTVEGFATHPTFRKWQLDLLLDGDADRATFLALGEKPIVAPSPLLTWDTTPYPNGEHLLRLRVVHSNLNYEEIFTPIVIMNGDAAPLAEKPERAEAETKPENPSQGTAEAAPVVFRTDAPPDGERWIEVIVSAVGDRFVLERMLEEGLNLGGEQSGHIIFADHTTTGDGLVTMLQLLKVMAESGERLSALGGMVERVPQVLVNVKVKDKSALERSNEVARLRREWEERLADRGRVLLRPSGTEPLVRVMVEALDPALAEEAARNLAALIERSMS